MVGSAGSTTLVWVLLVSKRWSGRAERGVVGQEGLANSIRLRKFRGRGTDCSLERSVGSEEGRSGVERSVGTKARLVLTRSGEGPDWSWEGPDWSWQGPDWSWGGPDWSWAGARLVP